MKVLQWSFAVVGIVFVVYTISLFATYPIARDFGRSEQIFRQDRERHNNPAPNTTQPMLSIDFNGPYEWNDYNLEEYQIYGVNSSALGLLGLDAEQAANGLDNNCTENRVAAKVKWRGNTKPPLKPSYKIKLYKCECEDDNTGPCEWKKLKLSESTPQLGYTGNRTNKWTLRSDRYTRPQRLSTLRANACAGLMFYPCMINMRPSFLATWADEMPCGQRQL